MRSGLGSLALALLVGSAVACGDVQDAPGDAPEIVESEVVEGGSTAAPAPDPVPGDPVPEEPVVADAHGATDSEIDALLAKRVSFDFAGASATEIVEMIAMVSGAKIVIDPEIAPELENVPVTLKMSDISALEALNTLAMVVGGKKVDVREHEVWLTNP